MILLEHFANCLCYWDGWWRLRNKEGTRGTEGINVQLLQLVICEFWNWRLEVAWGKIVSPVSTKHLKPRHGQDIQSPVHECRWWDLSQQMKHSNCHKTQRTVFISETVPNVSSTNHPARNRIARQETMPDWLAISEYSWRVCDIISSTLINRSVSV